MTARTIVLPLAVFECAHLGRLIDELRGMLTDDAAERVDDPAIDRLTPDAYPEDAEASLTFTQATRDELLDRRAADAAIVKAALAPFDEAAEELSEREALRTCDIVVGEADVDPWLRTLTALRLVIAARLGIVDDDQDGDGPLRGVYDWLGFRLESLVQAADELL
ncbi:DUF2017 family protein [Microbacterium sp. NPDC055903]